MFFNKINHKLTCFKKKNLITIGKIKNINIFSIIITNILLHELLFYI